MTSTNDGKDVKSNQTSSPKGKSYYIELYKSLEAHLSEVGDASERTRHLCTAWRTVRQLCLHAAPPTHAHLLTWIQRHTARTVLQTEWQTEKRKDDRASLEQAIDAYLAEAGAEPWERQLAARADWFKRVLDKPWDHPVLAALLNPAGTRPTDDEVVSWLSLERGVTLVARLHALAAERCDDLAAALAAALMERARAADTHAEVPVETTTLSFADRLREEADFTPDVWETLTDIEFVLLHKRDSKRCIALAKQTPLTEAYQLIERLQKRLESSPREKRLWKNAKEVAILIAQVVIARCMVVKSCAGAARAALYCCARVLARLLASRLPAAADALAAQAPTARHLHTLAQAVDKELSPTDEKMKPYVCELYVRAITAGMNELERLKLKTEKTEVEEARSMERTLSSWFVQLGGVLGRSARVACECTLTAFSLHPSRHMLQRILAAPPLPPVRTDANDCKEVTVKSEFGSWASDSRSQTNLVKTSETLNMKQTQHQANVMSTAILNEGEALGLSTELCHDIAVLLSGPRVKTLSWDMDRSVLQDKCRAYSEQTQGGTRALTRELKFLNIDPRLYLHLPEEKDDDEDDPYYGIERGYEHLAVLEEPEDMWNESVDPSKTETASSIEDNYLVPRRKKKTKKPPNSTDEDSDPLSFVAEAKRTQKKKERPLSKERSKERKKKPELVDPLDIEGTSQQNEIKPKKRERKKKEKVPKVLGGKKSSLANLVGVKVGKSKKSKDTKVSASVTDSDYDSQGKHSLTSLNSEGNEVDPFSGESIPASVRNLHEPKTEGTVKSNVVTYNVIGHKTHGPRAQINPARMQYRPPNTNAARLSSPSDYYRTMESLKVIPADVRANLSKVLDIRKKQRELQQKMMQQGGMQHVQPRKPAIVTPNIPLQTNISPKSVTIPEIPKSYINKEQAERMAQLSYALTNDFKDSVIQYGQKPDINKTSPIPGSSQSRNKQHGNSMKMTDILNPSFDRLLAEISERQRGQEIKAAHAQYQHSPPPLRPVQKSLNVTTPGQRDYQNFLKEYEQKKYTLSHSTNIPLKQSREAKKPMPVSRVVPVVPKVPKPEPKPVQQFVKQPTQVKKPEPTLNTFSRLSYHKNKQNEMKNKAQAPKPCGTTTYQEVSTELDKIIKDHQREQMRVIQTKRDGFDRYVKPTNVQDGRKIDSAAKGHPLLTNILQQSASFIPSYRNDNASKMTAAQQSSPPPMIGYQTEKDQEELLNLIRQQNNLNNYSNYYSNINSKPSTSTMSTVLPATNYTSPAGHVQQLPAKTTSQGTKTFASTLENKIINIISNTQLKAGNHEINKSISVSTKSSSSSTMKAVDYTIKHDVAKLNAAAKDTKKSTEVSAPEWQTVMCNLLKHKTPARRPEALDALDVALNKTSFEKVFEKSLKKTSSYEKNLTETSTHSLNRPALEKNIPPSTPHQKSDRQKPVVTSNQKVIITKKGIKLEKDISKLSLPPDSKAHSKPITMTEKLKAQNFSTATKKLPQEAQRKLFTYPGPKNIDPFISGIPNSDYDLLEELMDDDLRKEIGELSSDEESYNAAAQSFLKSPKTSNRRVSVHFNKTENETVSNPAINVQQFNDLSRNEISPEIRKSGTQGDSNMSPTLHRNNSLKTHQKAAIKTRDSNCNYNVSTNLCPDTQISLTSNVGIPTCNNGNIPINNQVMAEPNVYISTVTQPAPVQNVVLIGQQLVYGGYTTVQTPVQTMNDLVTNAYIAVNTTPTATLYQTTQYTAPVVIGTTINRPVINNFSCAAIPAQPSLVNMPRQSYPTVIEQRSFVAESVKTLESDDTHTKIQNLPDCTHQNPILKQEENKANERKVLCEVQDFALSENIDKARNQKIENNFDTKVKKYTVADMERLKKKRLAIINREIYHRCGEKIIPLTYSPLPVKIKTALENHDLSEAIPLCYTALRSKDDKQKLSDSEEEKLLAQIKNNLENLSECINEVASPATPESKENKSYSEVPTRRILLRSSNKITTKLDTEKRTLDMPNPRKSKIKIKSQAPEPVNAESSNNDEIKDKQISITKRASKRLLNKKPVPEENVPTETNAKPKAKSTRRKTQVHIETDNLEHLDIESDLQGSKISKVTSENPTEKDINKPTTCEVVTTTTNNEVLEESLPQKTPDDHADTSSEKTEMNTENGRDIVQDASIPDKSQKTTPPEEKEDISEDSMRQSSRLDQLSDKTAVEEDKINKDQVPEAPILNKANHLSKQTAELDQIILENAEVMKQDEKVVLHATNLEVPAYEKLKDNNSKSIPDKNVNISKPTCSDLEKNLNINDTKVPLDDAKDSINDQSVTTSSVGSLFNNDKRPAVQDNSSEPKSTGIESQRQLPEKQNIGIGNSSGVKSSIVEDQNSTPEKDNIDLDMTVTCEEVPKLSPTFGSIKTARRKDINNDKKENYAKDRNNGDMINHGVENSKNNKDITTSLTQEVEVSKEPAIDIETVNVTPTPQSWLADKTPPVTNNISSTAVDTDDDVVVIDDSPIKKPESENRKEKEKKAVHFNASALVPNKATAAGNHATGPTNTDTSAGIKSNKTQILHKEAGIPDCFKDKIQIEYLPTNDPLKGKVRVSLPNGRKVLATVHGKVHVTFDTLFTYPSVREALMYGMDSRKLLTLNIEQLATVDKSNPNRIISAEILKMETPKTAANVAPVETIDLLSDDEDNESPPEIDTNKHVFETEYGKFSVPSMDNDLFTKHQNKLSKKSQILLKRVDEKSNLQNKNTDDNTISSTTEIVQGDITQLIPNQYVTNLFNDIENLTSEVKPKEIPEVVEIDDSSNDSVYQGKTSDLTKEKTINDFKNVLLKELGVEEQAQNDKNNLQDDDDVVIVNEILPLKENNQRKIMKLSSIPFGESCRFNDLDETEQLQVTKRKCAIKLVRCDEVVETVEQPVDTKTKLSDQVLDDEPITIAEEFAVFDDLDDIVMESEERSSSPVIELLDVLVSLENKAPKPAFEVPQYTPQICKANWHNNKPALHLESVNNSQIIKSNITIYDEIMMDDNLIGQVIPQPCVASDHNTKLTLNSETNQDSLNVFCSIENDSNFCDENFIIPTVSQPCGADWLMTKLTMHTQAFNDTEMDIYAFTRDKSPLVESLTNRTIPILCEAVWQMTKSVIHLQDINDTLKRSHLYEIEDSSVDHGIPFSNAVDTRMTTAESYEEELVRSYVSECDYEMHEDKLIDITTPLSCDASWFASKPTLYLQVMNSTSLIRCRDVIEVISTDEKMPLSCEANWLATKSKIHLQAVNYEFVKSSCNKIRNDVSAYKFVLWSCEAWWHDTKASLNLEAAHRELNLQSKVIIKDINEELCVKSFASSETNLSTTIPIEVINTTNAPSLNTLVLDSLQGTNVIHQYLLLRESNNCSINLKRKAASPQNLSVCKVLKLDEPTVTEAIDGKILLPIAPYTTAPDSNIFSEKDINTESNEKILETEEYGNKCDRFHILENGVALDEQVSDLIVRGDDEDEGETVVASESSTELEKTPLSPFIDSTNITTENDASTQLYDRLNNLSETVEDLPQKLNDSQYCNNTEINHDPTANTQKTLEKPVNITDCFEDSNTFKSSPSIENRPISPFINATNIEISNDTSTQFQLHDRHDCLSKTVEEELTEILNDREFCNNTEIDHGPTLNAHTSLGKTVNITACVDDSTICKSPERKISTNYSLESKSPIVTRTQEMETCLSKNIDDHVDIEMKLTEINSKSIHEDITEKSEVVSELKNHCRELETIQIISGDEPCVNVTKLDEEILCITATDDKETECSEHSKIPVGQNSYATDHEYSIPVGTVLGSSEISKDEYEVVYSSTNDVLFLLEDETVNELEEEIVDMHDEEIVQNCFYGAATNVHRDETEITNNTDPESAIVAEDENKIDQCTIKEHENITPYKEEEVTAEDLTDNCYVTTKDGLKLEECTELFNNINEDSLNKYLIAIVQNKSEIIQSVVEYDDPESGACWMIPVIEDVANSDIESIKDTKNAKTTEWTINRKTKTIPVNGECPREDIKSLTTKENTCKDFEAYTTKNDGKTVTSTENNLKQAVRLDEKYNTSYSVEVEAVSNAENDPCRMWTTDQSTDTTDNVSGSSKRRRLTNHDGLEDVSVISDTENFNIKPPKYTYSKGSEKIKTRRKSLKRKIDMSDTKTSERKYRKGKNIDYPKFTAAALSETLYTREYKNLFDYCTSVKFSFSVPFHKESIDVHNTLKSWPIQNTHPLETEISVEKNEVLFTEIEKSEALLDPLEQTLSEEIVSKFDENRYTPSNIKETNFNMGFGERSGRVIQESRDGESTTFSAATLSDVKPLQPLLPSDKKEIVLISNSIHKKIKEQKLLARRYLTYLDMRERVRSFFAKTIAELNSEWNCNLKKDDSENDGDMFNWPFGELTSTRSIIPSPLVVTVNVVQVGQLPVSAAAQNPVTCDPRVTHVSNASPSQCSPETSMGDELQTPIKTEYTELTTADITLPLMQEYVQHHSMPSETQESSNLYGANDSTPISTQIKSVVKIELMEEQTQDSEDNVNFDNNCQLPHSNGNMSNNAQLQFENTAGNTNPESEPIASVNASKTTKSTIFRDEKQNNDIVEKCDQIAHAMSAAGISATKVLCNSSNADESIQETLQPNTAVSQANSNHFSKTTPINALALQQALAQILPPPLNHTNQTDNNPQTSANPQVLHIVQGNNTQSVISKPNGTQLLHIVQNKGVANSNGSPAPQQNSFSGLSLVDGAIQQSGNQLLHIVNAANQKNTNAGQLLKRMNLLTTNLTQGSNEQKMVQFVCKSADGKSIQLPHQRSMVLRLQTLDSPNVSTIPKQNDNQEHSSSSATTHSINEKDSSPQEMKSRSLYEENYAKFVQNDPKFAQNGDNKLGSEKATSLPKFNQVFGKQVYQDKPSEIDTENLQENSEPPDDNTPLEQLNDISNPPMLIRKTNPTQPSHVQPNLVQQIKHTLGPMNIQTMHGGVIYTRQIPVNIGNGQTINLITVPSTELVDDSAQKQQSDSKFGNQEGDPPIIKIVPTNQPAATPNTSTDDNNAPIRSTNEANPQPNPQPQPVLTQMRIKLPMLSKAPQMVGGTRVVRPSFFQIQRNVIGGANQQVYQQLVLTAAPPLGQSIRLPTPAQKPKTQSETQSSPESQMSSSTLEQLREFDMVLEQVKERSTVQPGSSTTNSFTKLKGSPDTTDSPTASTSTQETPTQVLYSVGNTQPLGMVNYVTRKSTITSTTTSSFVRSPDSTGTVDSPSSSTHSHLPHTVTSDSCASSSCASEAAAATAVQPKPKKKKPKPSTSNSNPFNIKNTPKPSSQKPLEDEQTTQRILYILAEYKEQVENSPDKDKPAPRRRNNPAAPNAGSSKRKKSSSGSRRRDMSPVLGEDSCRTMGSEDSSCGTSLGECNECLETHSPEESPKKVVRRLTFEQETPVTQPRTATTTTTTPVPQRNVIVTDGQAFAVRGATGKPATTVLMPANYLLPVSMVKGGQQIAIVTNRGPKLLVGAGEGGTGGTLLFQRLIGPGGLKPVLARPGVRHIRLPTTALHNLQAFNIATPTANVQPPDSTASPAPAPTPPDLVDTRAMSSPWPDRDAGEIKPERGNSSPEGSEPWNLPSSSIADDYGYEEIVRTDNMDRTVLDAIPDRYSPDLEAQRIFDKMFDSDSKKSMYDSRYDIDASDDDKAYQVVHRKDGRHTTRLTHVSAAALRHKYAILEHELRLQKSLSEECEDLGVDSPSASELFPEAELLFAPSPAHEQTIDQCHTPQPIQQGIPQPDLDDQIATDQLLTHRERHDDLDINLDDVGEIVTVGEDGMTTIPLDHEEFARSHPNTTFHSEPEDGEVPPFTIAQGVKGRQITFQARGGPGAVVLAPQTTVISQATVKFADLDNIITALPSQHAMPSVLKETDNLTKFDRLLNESRDLNVSNATSAIVHSTGNGTQVIRRVQYERRDSRYLVEEDAMIAGDAQKEEDSERHPELFWDQSRAERKPFDFSSDSDKCCKSPYDETNSDSSGIGAHTRLDSVIKAARTERRRSDGSSAEESHPPLRTYPAKRTHTHTHHDADRSVTGKTRATDRCHDVRDESRRRASNRGVVKRGCHCCNGSSPPKPKKSRPKKTDYPHN